METTQNTVLPPEYQGLTFEKVWAAIQATDAQIKATDAQIKATDAQIKATGEQMKETDRQMKETDKRIGKLGNRFGEMIEYMVVPNLVTKFKNLGFTFEKTHQNTVIRDRENQVIAEIDVFMENGDRTMVVEIKTNPTIRDIQDHLERMGKLRRYADAHNDRRKYLGAIAGVVFHDNEKTYAMKQGFYVIEPSGDTFNIIEPSGEYRPREW
jgi:uncharacterized coiled-coil DUF342 family protein